MAFKAYELPELFEDGPPLIPPGWNPILWNEFEDELMLCDARAMPGMGEIVAVLVDKRIVPSEAFNTKLVNSIKPETFKGEDFTSRWFASLCREKSPIRRMIIARYDGLDHYGYPCFAVSNLTYGDTAYAVAWRPLDLPFVDDVEI